MKIEKRKTLKKVSKILASLVLGVVMSGFVINAAHADWDDHGHGPEWRHRGWEEHEHDAYRWHRHHYYAYPVYDEPHYVYSPPVVYAPPPPPPEGINIVLPLHFN